MNTVVTSLSDQQTQHAGEEFAHELQPGDIVCLYGDLGAGKTTFTKGIAKGLGLTTRILSPTFSLIRMHEVHSGTIKMLNHIDLYRLDTLEDIHKIGIDEIFEDPDGVTIIEWADKMKEHIPKKRIDIQFQIADQGQRVITIKKYE